MNGEGAPAIIGLEAFAGQLAWLLVGVSVVGLVAKWLRVPYAVALVLGGLVAAQTHATPVPTLGPDLLLFIFLPPLLFDAAFRLDTTEFRTVWRSVLLLAVPGVLLTTVLVGGTLALLLHLPLATALLFGSIVAATDPVAVTAVFKELRVSSRLSIIAEGESLLNDGVAVTLFTVLALFTVQSSGAGGVGGEAGAAAHVDRSALGIALFFGREVIGGLAIGLGTGFAASRVTRLIDDHFLEMTLSTALAFGSYLLAHAAGASGPMACVAAGALHGSYGRSVGMSQRTRRLLDDLWEYLGFLANGLLFLLVGFSVDLGILRDQVWPVGIAVGVVVIARVVVVEAATRVIRAERIFTTGRARLVLVWGGLRGALTMALALALPQEEPSRALVVAMALGVVLFTLVVQGLTLRPLIQRLGLSQSEETEPSAS